MKKERKAKTIGEPPTKRLNGEIDEHICRRIVEELKTTNVPITSKFREKEKTQITDFVKDNVSGKSSASTLIVFGQPGLGKTLVLKEISRTMMEESLDGMDTHYVNAMSYVNSSTFIDDLAMQLRAPKSRSGVQFRLEALKRGLERSTRKRPMLLLIDELETLSFHESDFPLVFDLLSTNIRGFVKICISNTLELFPASQGQTTAYLNFTFLAFQPYTAEQLDGLLRERLTAATPIATKLWPRTAIEYLAKKAITSHASDVRLMLAVAQEVTERRMQEQNFGPIAVGELVSFFEHRSKNDMLEVALRMSYQLQVLLLAFFEKLGSSGKQADAIAVTQLTQRFYEVLDVLGLETSERVPELLETLDAYNFLKIEDSGKGKNRVKFARTSLSREELERVLAAIPLFKRFFAAVSN